MQDTLSIFWFFMPAAVATMAPVLFKWLPIFDTPIDFGKKLNGMPIFGPHKTYRGFIVGVIFAIATVYLQKSITPDRSYWLVNYAMVSAISLGFLQGFGALLGDLIKSFFKRRIKIPSGHTWVPFDQIDWVIGTLIFCSLMVSFTLTQLIISIILFGLIHPVVNIVGYGLRIKSNKF